jgi:hypothetical protein
MRIFLITILFSVSCIRAQSLSDSALIHFYRETIHFLANDSMGGRPVSSAYEKKSADFIVDQFKKMGFQPRVHRFKYREEDSSSYRSSMNVYCFVNNRSDSTIIIGAHYDHIGMGGPLSMNMGKSGIHNGADDNASGVALLLGIANEINSWDIKKYNFLFVAYSAHEVGLFGSEAFSRLVKSKHIPISLVINFDMVGRMNPELRWLKIAGINTLKKAGSFFEKDKYDLKFRLESDSLLNQLDTKTFFKMGFPCLTFTTGIHEDYHKMTDDESKINYGGIIRIQQLIHVFLKEF